MPARTREIQLAHLHFKARALRATKELQCTLVTAETGNALDHAFRLAIRASGNKSFLALFFVEVVNFFVEELF